MAGTWGTPTTGRPIAGTWGTTPTTAGKPLIGILVATTAFTFINPIIGIDRTSAPTGPTARGDNISPITSCHAFAPRQSLTAYS